MFFLPPNRVNTDRPPTYAKSMPAEASGFSVVGRGPRGMLRSSIPMVRGNSTRAGPL